jgi:hypothetical protein
VTYGLVFASPAFAGVVTDRRLTGGGRVEEDSNKCGMVVYTDGRLAYSFSGVAEQSAFRTRRWLAEKLCEAGAGGRSIDAALKEFAASATADLAKMRFRKPEEGLLTVAFAGFRPGPFGNAMAVLRLVSNFEKFGEPSATIPRRQFEVSQADFDLSNEYGIGIVPIGAWTTRTALQPLADALGRPVPPTVAVDAAVQIIRAAATPAGPIGTWCSSVVLPRLGNQSAWFDYHPGKPREDHKLPTFVYAKHDKAGAFILTEIGIRGSVGGRAATRVPKVGRHQPCPCGSGRRFKDCHGGKRTAEKADLMGFHIEGMFKLLPSEDIDIARIASTGIALGPSEFDAIATFAGAPTFRLRQRSPEAEPIPGTNDSAGKTADHTSET